MWPNLGAGTDVGIGGVCVYREDRSLGLAAGASYPKAGGRSGDLSVCAGVVVSVRL